MANNIAYRRQQVKQISNVTGCYVLCDIDGVPIYVGQSKDGIRRRVSRHLTSARSDIIANRQVDVWEIAWVLTYESKKEDIDNLESALFHHCSSKSELMNGTVPPVSVGLNLALPSETQRIQVMTDTEIKEKQDLALRLPRQAEQYSQIVGHFLAVKNSKEIARAIEAHFQRLSKYHNQLLNTAQEPDAESGDMDT
jgi:hypothetical protein